MTEQLLFFLAYIDKNHDETPFGFFLNIQPICE